MIKERELLEGCMAKARDGEMTFVLLGRDAAAPVAIRAWIEERIRLGKNTREDAQIVEAEDCIRAGWPSVEYRLPAQNQGEIERLKDVLHRDQTGMAHALAEVVKTVDGYSWATQGRGPYSFDDDEYRKEMGRMLRDVRKLAADALAASGKLAHRECCGRGS